MENSKTAENNRVTLSGTVSEECTFSHEVYGEGFYIFKMNVRRLSDNDDVLPVTVSERLMDVNSLKKGMSVNVSGQLRSYNHYSGNKIRLILTAFAREISIGGESPSNPNEIFLNGFVCKPPVYRITPFGREITRYQCIQYALDKPGVLTVLPGIRNKDDVEQLLGFLDASTEEKDYSAISTLTPDDADGRCMYCNHCQPCPAGLNIGLINKYYDLAMIGDRLAANHYAKLDRKASDCISCGHCDRRCPFHVHQSERMAEIAAYFGK